MTTLDRPATYREVFAVAAFRVLFLSRTLAISANTLRIVALSLLVFNVTGSTFLTAITFGIGFLPQVVGGALLGSLSDRLRPRPLIAAGYLLECAIAVILAALHLPIAVCLLLVAVAAVFTPVFSGSTNRLLAQELTGDVFVLGRSLTSVAAGAAQIVGMAFGGLAIAAVGPRQALFISAGLLLISAAVTRFALPDRPIPAVTGGTSALRQSWSTNAFLLGTPPIRRLLLIQWLPAAFFVGAEGLIVAYSSHRGFTSGATGLMLAAAPAGMLLGDLVVGRFVRPSVRIRLVAPLIAVLAVPLLILAVNPPLPWAVTSLAIGGIGFAYMLGVQQPFLDAIPETSRGQSFALLSTGLMTFQGLGPLFLGGAAQQTGIHLTLALSALAILAAAAFWAVSSRRRISPI